MIKRIIDSQILIALLNPKDVFHQKAKELVLGDSVEVVLLDSVKKEVRNTFLMKYNKACIKIYKIANKIRQKDFETKEELIKFAEKELENVISEDPGLRNFYLYVFSLIKDKLTDKDELINVPTILNDHAIEIESKMVTFSENVTVVDIGENKLILRKEIYKLIEDFNFELKDMEIFCDAVAYAIDTGEECEFYTGDKDFYETAIRALEKVKEGGYTLKLSIRFFKTD